MKIAVLSDIHDNVWKLEIALKHVEACDLMVCCGDLCSPFVLDQLARGFSRPLHIVFGNNDADLFRITNKAATLYPHIRLRGEFFAEELGGRSIAVNHFDNIAMAIARGGKYDAVLYGHNHVYRIHREGATLCVNPGAIMGAQFDAQANRTDVASTFAVYDTETGEATGFEIDGEATNIRAASTT